MTGILLPGTPASVQVELSPDTDIRSYCLVGTTLNATGCSAIRIDTECFPFATRMVHHNMTVVGPSHLMLLSPQVRLHLQRPEESSNMNLSQITLTGVTTSMWKSESVFEKWVPT